MLRLEARPQPSRAMSLASPLIALALTVLIAGDPVRRAREGSAARPQHVLRRAAADRARAHRGRAKGDAARPVRARARRLLPGERLEHRRRGPVPPRRDHRRRRRPVRHDARHRGPAVGDDAGGLDGGHPGRHGVGVDHRAAAGPLQRERDPGQPDARVRGAAAPQLSRVRAVEGPAGFQLPADQDLRRGDAAAELGAAVAAARRLRDHARARGGVLGVHVPRVPRLPAAGRRARTRRGALCGILGPDRAVDRAPRLRRDGGARWRDGGGGTAAPTHATRVDRLRLHRDHRLFRRPAASGRLPLRRRAAVDAPDRRRARAIAARAAARADRGVPGPAAVPPARVRHADQLSRALDRVRHHRTAVAS